MAIKKLEDGRWQADSVRADGKRARRIFNRRSEAVAFEATLNRERYESKLVRTGLLTQRYPMDRAIDDYEATKGVLRPSSIKRYKAIFHQLRVFTKACNIQYVDEFSPDHATLLFNELIREKRDPKGNTDRMMTPKPRTVNQFLQHIRSFFEYEMRKDHIHKNPMRHIRNLRTDRALPEYYTQEELQRFFAQEMPVAYRNAFLALLHSGMRFAELANLSWEDIDLQNALLYVRSKTDFKTKTHNAERAIPMNGTLLHVIRSMQPPSDVKSVVFTSPGGRKLRAQSLLDVCKKFMHRANVDSRAYLHKFRHTFATHLVQQGKSLESIKELLGHSTIRETEIYAHNRSDHLHNDVRVLDDLMS